jgi:hypothetical protein
MGTMKKKMFDRFHEKTLSFHYHCFNDYVIKTGHGILAEHLIEILIDVNEKQLTQVYRDYENFNIVCSKMNFFIVCSIFFFTAVSLDIATIEGELGLYSE